MIRAATGDGFDRLAPRLMRKAAAMTIALASARCLNRKHGPARWRRADLLWPLFTKG